MSTSRLERGSLTTQSDVRPISGEEVIEHRRRRSLPRALIARSRATAPRTRKTALMRTRPLYEPRLVSIHDFGDGRQALEFEGPSLDLMLYHDRGVTLAEWVTVDGELVTMAVVGDC